MYQSYTFNSYGWTIIDDDFTETTINNSITIWDFIVEVYEKRNLDVVPNLARAFVKWDENMDKHTLFKWLPDKYKPELEKYLLLM